MPVMRERAEMGGAEADDRAGAPSENLYIRITQPQCVAHKRARTNTATARVGQAKMWVVQ